MQRNTISPGTSPGEMALGQISKTNKTCSSLPQSQDVHFLSAHALQEVGFVFIIILFSYTKL